MAHREWLGGITMTDNVLQVVASDSVPNVLHMQGYKPKQVLNANWPTWQLSIVESWYSFSLQRCPIRRAQEKCCGTCHIRQPLPLPHCPCHQP